MSNFYTIAVLEERIYQFNVMGNSEQEALKYFIDNLDKVKFNKPESSEFTDIQVLGITNNLIFNS